MSNFDYYSWVFLPLLIFASRIGDVTLGTIRHVLMARGQKNIAPILGFFEVLIWIIVVSQVMKQADNFACYFAWAAGFAMGNFVGLYIEGKIALGQQIIRIISHQDCQEMLAVLQTANHGVTVVDGKGHKGPVKIIFMIVKRKEIGKVIGIIEKHNKEAFYSIEDVRDVRKGVFSKKAPSSVRNLFSLQKATVRH